MLRLPSLDEHLAAALRRLARGALQETVLLLLSDHGTHGIWYSNEFELGAAEHKLPLLFVVAPDWLPSASIARSLRQQRGVKFRFMGQIAADQFGGRPGLPCQQMLQGVFRAVGAISFTQCVPV